MFFYCFSTAVPFLCFRCSFLLRRSPEELSGIRGRELTTEPSIGVDQEHTVSPSESETRERLFHFEAVWFRKQGEMLSFFLILGFRDF